MTSLGLRGLLGSCVSDRSSTDHFHHHHPHNQQQQHHLNAPLPAPTPTSKKAPASPKPLNKVKFGVPLSESVRDDCLPVPLVDMLVYIAQEGVTTTDLFRRGGNPTDLKIITKKLTEGKPIQFNNYNFYTLASVIKKFLLRIPGGVLGPKVERKLLDVLLLDNRMQQYDTIHSIISSLAPATQQLLALLFGTWFRIVNHSEYNTMSSEAMAKSVAGSLFHTCNDDPYKVEIAVQVLQILIDDFGVANMFGRKNIQYFADKTRTGIRVREKFCYEFRHPMEGSTQSITEEEFYGGRSSGRRATEGNCEEELGVSTSTPPSPQSLQPHPTYHDSADSSEYNPHKKLTHVSSLSAPEVNKGYSPTTELSPAKRLCLTTSLSRFDNVRRRQMLRMRKRTNWFLSPNQSAGLDSSRGSDSLLGSAEGKSSDAAMSVEDALLSSDGCLSDVSRLGAGSAHELDSTANTTTTTSSSMLLTTPAHHHHSHHHARGSRGPSPQPYSADVVNGNHHHQQRTSTPAKRWGVGATVIVRSRSPSPSSTTSSSNAPLAAASSSAASSQGPQTVSERDVRYFMVDNYYGGGGGGDNNDSRSQPGGATS